MKIIKKILCEPLFYLLPLLALAGFWIIPAKPNISDVVSTIEGKPYPESFPISTNKIREHSNFSISFNVIKKNKDFVYKFYPDDCILSIEINGKAFPQEMVKKPCDYNNGIILDLSDYMQKGLNKVEFQMKNHGGPGGLRIDYLYEGFSSVGVKQILFSVLLLIVSALILKKFKFSSTAISIILLGVGVRLILYTYTGPMQYSHDTSAHLRYVQIISEEKRIPKNNEGGLTFHPPLYYAVSAVIKNIVDRYDPKLTNRILQQESLLISFASVVLAVALIINLFGNCWAAYLAALVSVLWPGFVIAAPRIGNDSLFYLGALLCMLFAQKYWQTYKNSDMLLASLGASIALAAKSTGFVILSVWVAIYIFSVVRLLKFGSLRTLFASIFIIVLFIGFSNYRTIINILAGKKVSLIENSNDLGDNIRVNNVAGNYLYFDLQDYLLNPYTSPFIDEGGRQYFWNFALKTSLFREFRLWISPIGYTIATILSSLALLIFMLALWGIIHAKFKDLPSLLFAVFLFSALIYLRVSYPYSCSNDFRYIFPVLFPLVYFSVCGVQILQNSRLRKLSYIGMLAFATLSFAFIVVQAI